MTGRGEDGLMDSWLFKFDEFGVIVLQINFSFGLVEYNQIFGCWREFIKAQSLSLLKLQLIKFLSLTIQMTSYWNPLSLSFPDHKIISYHWRSQEFLRVEFVEFKHFCIEKFKGVEIIEILREKPHQIKVGLSPTTQSCSLVTPKNLTSFVNR